MIDTIKLVIPCRERLTPQNSPFCNFSFSTKGFRNAHLDAKKLSSQPQGYLPTIAYLERPQSPQNPRMRYELTIELSLPKFLFGNNIQEISEGDFSHISKKIASFMFDTGFSWITPETIRQANVRRLDVGKNIIIDTPSQATETLRLFGMADMNRHCDFEQRIYSNGGQLLRLHTKSEDIVFYNKSEESRNNNDRTQPLLYQETFLRFEIKMNNTPTIRRRLKAIGANGGGELTFERLFNQGICRRLVWDKFEKWYSAIPKSSLCDINPEQRLYAIICDEMGCRGGLSRALQRFAITMIDHLPNMTTTEVNNLLEGTFGASARKKIKELRSYSPPQTQLKLLLTVKHQFEDFSLITPGKILELSKEK